MPQAAIAYVAKAFASMVVSHLVSKLFIMADKPDDPSSQKDYGLQVNHQSSKVPLPLIYGQARVGINRAYIATSGSDNKYLHIIGLLGEGEIDGFSDQVGGIDPLYFNNKLYTEFGSGNVYYELFTGAADQAVCSTLQSAIPEWTDPLKNTAYIYIRLLFDRDKFQGVPDITVGLQGLKVLNPTTSVTAYSNNPALCVYNMMTRSSVRGGFGIAGSRILTSSVETARAYCSDNGWTCNQPISTQAPITDNIRLLLNNYRGEIIKSASQFKFAFRDLNEEAVVEAFDEDSIVAGSLQIQQPDVFDMYNAVRILYLGEDGATDGSSTYKEKEFIFTESGLTADDGSYNEYVIKCHGLSDLDKVQEMAYYFRERFQLNKTFDFIAGQKAAKLEPMDLITISHTMPGWDTKYGRILSVSLNADYTVSLKCVEEHSAFYDSVYDPQSLAWYDTTLPDPNAEPSPVINVALSEEIYYYRNRSFTRLKLDFDVPDPADDPFFEYAEVYLKIGSGDYKYMTRSEGDFQVDPVEEGEAYYLKLRSVNIYGVRQPDENAVVVSKTITGKTDVPTNLSSMTAVANGDSVSIFADPISDPDIEGYEVRLGDAWAGAIFISFNKNCSLRLNGVRPGTHTFWMSPRDNAGNYSATPVSATVTVFMPPGYSQLATYGSWAWDFTSGTHDNTEHTTYSSEDAMKCSHTSDVLTGTFTSPTYDLNAVETVRVWGDFRTSFVSSATTWEGVAPAGITWDDLGSDLSWMEIFNPEAAGRVEAVLQYSSDGSNWSEIGFFEVLCAEITARYLKVEITLTDPTLDSNLYLRELNMLAYEGPQ